jgi:ribosomal protein S18 acetylase RimI-like enzyme
MEIKIIENATSKLIMQVAEIHAGAYSSEHFSAGFTLLMLTEYNARLIEVSDITILAIDGDIVLGYIISGFNFSAGIDKFITDNRLWLLFHISKSPLVLLNKLLGFFRSRLYKKNHSGAKYRLLSIATLPGCQGRGVGSSMLNVLEQELLSRDVDLYGLSVKDSNVAAIRFYEHHGFVKEKSNSGLSYYIKQIVKK